VFFTAVLAAAALLGACSNVVRLPDCIDCRPVEMATDQKLEVELGSDRSVTKDPDAYAWFVTETGTMTLMSEDRGTRSEDEDEFVGGYSRYVIYTFEPTAAGTVQMQFELVPRDEPEAQPVNTLDITVIVND